MGYLTVKDHIQNADNIYKIIDLLRDNSSVVQLCKLNNWLVIIPSCSEWNKFSPKDRKNEIENSIRLHFMPDYDNMEEKIALLEYMGVNFVDRYPYL